MVATDQSETQGGDRVTFKGEPVVLASACDGLAGRHHCIEHNFTAAHNMDAHTHKNESCRWVWVCPEHGPEGTA